MDEKKQERQAKREPLQVTICGGGNAAHAFAASVGACMNPNVFKVNWLSLYKDEAKTINDNLAKNDGYITADFKQFGTRIQSRLNLVTNDPSKAIPNSDIVILCIPAFAHKQYLDVIREHHEVCGKDSSNNDKKLIIGAFPAAGGFEFLFLNIFAGKEDKVVLFNCLTLPWACRISKYGEIVDILGIKDAIDVYCWFKTTASDKDKDKENEEFTMYLNTIESLFFESYPRLKINENYHILSSTLGCMNPVVHPSIMYGKWKGYKDGTTFKEIPLFYEGISKESAEFMSIVSDEVIKICGLLNDYMKKNNVGNNKKIVIPHVLDFQVNSYPDTISKKDNLRNAFVTNTAMAGLVHPMKKLDNNNNKEEYVPDFNFRYLTEDVPFGLLINKAIANLLEDEGVKVNTPNVDKICLWAQKRINRDYFIQDKDGGSVRVNIKSNDIQKSRIPQILGFDKLEKILAV